MSSSDGLNVEPEIAEARGDPQPLTSVSPTGSAEQAACVSCGQRLPAQAPSPEVPGAQGGGFVYAVGRLRAEFPNEGVKKEFVQLTGVDPDALVQVSDLKDALVSPESRYLARHVCWVFRGQTSDSCSVVARDNRDLDELLDLLTTDEEEVIETLVGSPVTGVSSPCIAAGLVAVWPDQVLRFTMQEFIEALPGPEMPDATDQYRSAVRTLFTHLTQRAGNQGLADQHRALNYLALRYPQLYHLTFRLLREGKALIGVDAHSGFDRGRRLVVVRLVFRDQHTHLVERYQCTVDVTDLFPFLTASLSQTFD
jgi:hypothetical protein